MIRLLSLSAAALLLVGAAEPAAPGLQGEWRNTNNTVHLRVKPCGPALCGTVTWAAPKQRADAQKGSGKDLVGSVLLQDLKPRGKSVWRGSVYIPDINTTASATVTQLDRGLIRISGCTLMGLACKTQHWHRIG